MSPFVYYPNKTKTKVDKKQIFTQKDYRLAKSMPLKCLASYFFISTGAMCDQILPPPSVSCQKL